MKNNKDNQKEQLEKQGKYFHLRLFRYYYLYTTEEERKQQKDTDILFFELDNTTTYSIRYLDLKQRADEETKQFLEEKNLQIPEFTIKGNNNIDYLIKLPTA
jgi:hypothetical protein